MSDSKSMKKEFLYSMSIYGGPTMLQALYDSVGWQKNNTIKARFSVPWTPILGSNEQIIANYTVYSLFYKVFH